MYTQHFLMLGNFYQLKQKYFKENLGLNDLSLCMLKIDCDFFYEFLYPMTTCFLYFAILSTFLSSSI